MSFAILGSRGQLAQAFLRRLGGRAAGLTREQADLTKGDLLRSALAPLKPDVVINCAAYNWVDQAETDAETPFAVNAHGVANLAAVCAELGATLVHFSTNYAFGMDVARRHPYRETDDPAPQSVYAK